MKGSFSTSVVRLRLPVAVTSVDQYWGSLLKISGTDFCGEETYFRLLYCDWFIALEDRKVAESSSSGECNKEGLALLVGRSIKDFVVDTEVHHVILVCSDGIQISLAANFADYEDDDQMLVMCLSNMYISYCPKLGLVVEPRPSGASADNT